VSTSAQGDSGAEEQPDDVLGVTHLGRIDDEDTGAGSSGGGATAEEEPWPTAIVDPNYTDKSTLELGKGGLAIDVMRGAANSAKPAGSPAEAAGHPSGNADAAFPIATGSPRRRAGASAIESYGAPRGGPAGSRTGSVGPEGRDRKPSDPTVGGPRMGAVSAEDDIGAREPGDPTVSGGRLGVNPQRPIAVAPVPNGLDDVMVLPPPPDRTGAKPRPPRPTPEVVPGLEVVKPMVLDLVAERSPAQLAATGKDPEITGEKVRRRVEFQHQRFEFLRIRRPLYRIPGVDDPVPADRPAWLTSAAPFANGMLAQLVAARFSDHDSYEPWSRILRRFDVAVRVQRLITAVDEAAVAAAPVFAALESSVLSAPKAIDEIDLGARYPEPGKLREGRIRAAVNAKGVWIMWRALDDHRPMLPPSVSPPEKGRRAFFVMSDIGAQRREGRWAAIRQKLHGALPKDPERAAYGLFLAHRVRRAWTRDPDPAELAKAAAAFHRWATQLRATFDDVPRSSTERVVLSALATWEQLRPVDDAGALAAPLETMGSGRKAPIWNIEARDGSADRVMAWHSLIETCHDLGIRPWDYLHELFEALAVGDVKDPKKWTPAAWQASARG
jgi:hypothetical protein